MTEPFLSIVATGQRVTLPRPGSSILIGRSVSADVSIPQVSCSREQCRVHVEADGVVLEPLSLKVPTSVNGTVVGARTRLGDGDVVAFGQTSFTFYVREPVARPDGTPPADLGQTEFGIASASEVTQIDRDVVLRGRLVIGRGGAGVDIVLDHPSVSRRHAEVEGNDAGSVVLRDLQSTNGTFVNGKRLASWQVLADGDRIDIGPYALELTGNVLRQSSREGNLRIVAEHLTRTVQSLEDGRELRILEDVTLVLGPREFVCLLGPSGSGKSTLMNALSARAPADQGSVLLNDVDLYANFDALKMGMAMVPQHDLLHEDLALEQALYFTAKLRFPPDTSEEQLRDAVQSALESVDLTHRAKLRIKDLSGGQKKRASLANETISRPNLLFLDEVTSGLDEGIDWEMMKLFREMADRGMMVVCVTHSLANVQEFCHKVAFVAAPGVLAFYGTPAEARTYFGVEKLGDVYRTLGTRTGAEWQERFRGHPLYEQHVLQRMPRARQAVRPPAEPNQSAGWRTAVSEWFRQLVILARRLTSLTLADRQALLYNLLQGVVIGVLLPLVFETLPDPDPREYPMMFLLGVSAFWFGCNNASKEIVKERQLYLRERDVNLSVSSYVLSKVLVTGTVVFIQVVMLFLMVATMSRIPGDDGRQLLQMAVTGLTGTCMGLLISAGSRSIDQANTLVPIALIPQIVLAGIMVEKLPPIPDFLAHGAISGFWMFEGMKAVLEGDRARQTLAIGVQLAHCATFLAIAFAILFLRDGRGVKHGEALRRWVARFRK